MHTYVRTLEKVISRYGPSRVISFDIVHVFITLQLIEQNGHVSRNILCKELVLGEGSIKTLIKHLKMQGIVESTNAGTTQTRKGKSLFSAIKEAMPFEMKLSKCSIALGKFNYAVILKKMAFAIKSGIEQRDAAIKIGASGATTLICVENRFVIPHTNYDALKNEQHILVQILQKLRPEDQDVLIIGSDDRSEKKAEFAAKSASLATLMSHEKH